MNANGADVAMQGERAIFFDGSTATRHDVSVELAPVALRVRDNQGGVLAEWPYDQLETLSAPDDVLRLGRAGNPVLARLEGQGRKIGGCHR